MTAKKPKIPEVGGWPDKVAPVALVVGVILSMVGFLMAFLFIPPVNGASVDGVELIGDAMVSNVLLLSQKIFFFHMPVALVSFVALAFAAFYSLRFLMTRNRRFDTCAGIAMEVALVFVIATMATGEMWTRFEWGVWWTWEPRLTTYLILMLIVIAYLVLRSMIDDPERRSAVSAVVGIIAFIDVPICFMITRLVPSSLHPVITREGGMTPEMGICVAIVVIAFGCIAFAVYRLRFRQVRLTQRVEAAKEILGD